MYTTLSKRLTCSANVFVCRHRYAYASSAIAGGPPLVCKGRTLVWRPTCLVRAWCPAAHCLTLAAPCDENTTCSWTRSWVTKQPFTLSHHIPLASWEDTRLMHGVHQIMQNIQPVKVLMLQLKKPRRVVFCHNQTSTTPVRFLDTDSRCSRPLPTPIPHRAHRYVAAATSCCRVYPCSTLPVSFLRFPTSGLPYLDAMHIPIPRTFFRDLLRFPR